MFPILILGDSGVGKTTFLNRYRKGEYITKHAPTVTTRVKKQVFATNHGPVTFNTIDGVAKYFSSVKGAVIMATEITAPSILHYYEMVREQCGKDIPIVVVLSKDDKGNGDTRSNDQRVKTITNNDSKVFYTSVSAYSFRNIESPYYILLRELVNKNIEIVEREGVFPPEVLV